MSLQPLNNEHAPDILDQALASVQREAVPAGPSPELISATHETLWYPFRSTQVAEICRHMTPDETRRLTVYAQRVGLIVGIGLSLVLYPLFFYLAFYTPLFPPRPWTMLVLSGMAFLFALFFGWFDFGGIRRKQVQMLCDTEFAQRQGITPKTLRLYQFTGQRQFTLFLMVLLSVPAFLLTGLLWLGPLIPGVSQVLHLDDVDSEARQILKRTTEVYANCKSYQDSGVGKLVILQNGGRHEDVKPFTTAFVRPGRLRYELNHKSGRKQYYRYIIWADGRDVQSWWDLRPGIEKPQSLAFAFAGAEGAGGSSAIATFLLPSKAGINLGTTLTAAKLEPDDTLDGVACLCLSGRYAGEPITLWIDKQTHLIRQIFRRSLITDFIAEQTLIYTPIINGEVTDAMLEFNPPVAK